METFFSVFRELNTYYVDEVDPDELFSSAIEGMLRPLDPYTTYIPEADMADYKFMTTGEYAGIGAVVKKGEDGIIIDEIYEGSPVARAGIRVGDVITMADGKSVRGLDPDAVSSILKGEPGSKLRIEVLRSGTRKKITADLIRQRIVLPNVAYSAIIAPNIAYISLQDFTPGAAREVKEALLLMKQKSPLSGLVLDLRGNPGGLLNEAVEVVNLFVPRGQDIVGTHGKVKQLDNLYKTRREPLDTLIPLVVLVNRMSASASEIVAGALQDLDRAVIVGQRTYGKGLVQTTRPLTYNSELKVTISKYYIPSGRCIQAVDYSKREEDGSVGSIPDSLTREFKTLRSGRPVRDGGGISPDIEVLPQDLSRIALELFTKDIIFDYVTGYMREQDSIPAPARFHYSDKDYLGFVDFARKKGFQYETGTEQKFRELKAVASSENFTLPASVIQAFEQHLAQGKAGDYETYAGQIRSLIIEEILGRAYYQAGRMSAILMNDAQADTAVSVLSSSGRYHGILSPPLSR